MGHPGAALRRQALSDYEIGGVRIAEGDKVVFWHAAANRDPRALEDTCASISSARRTTTSASRGAGPHYCLGASLARMRSA